MQVLVFKDKLPGEYALVLHFKIPKELACLVSVTLVFAHLQLRRRRVMEIHLRVWVIVFIEDELRATAKHNVYTYQRNTNGGIIN